MLVAGSVAGLTGFGLTLISTPALLLIFDPVTVVVVNAILVPVTGLVIVFEAWQEVRLRSVLALLPWSLLGLLLGTELLVVLDPDYIKLVAGLVVLCTAFLLTLGLNLTAGSGRWAAVTVGASSGVLATSIGFPSPLAALLFAARGFAKDSLRASSAAYFSAIGVIGLAVLVGRDLAQVAHFTLAVTFIPTALTGKILGSVLLRRLSEKSFRRVSFGVAMLAGIIGVSTALEALF